MFLKKLFGDSHSRALKPYWEKVKKINAIEEEIAAYSDEQLKAQTLKFKNLLSEGKSLEDILVEAFATVREVSKRLSGERHYDVQLIGGMILHDGKIPEMRTGEGKTLVATLPTYLNALIGRGVHVVTVNDYLARRDAVWMGQIYNFLGLSVGIVNTDASYIYDSSHVGDEQGGVYDTERDASGSFRVVHDYLKPVSRKAAYAADITYATNNELGFDYLRDNIEYETSNLRQRDFYYAIIDEVDSILIDEARTPLIISGPAQQSENLYQMFASIVSGFQIDRDYTVDEKLRAVSITDEGIARTEKALGIENIYTEKGIRYVHHLENAVKAKALYIRDKEYVVRDGNVVIVDEFTGRLKASSRWSNGIHQAVEAKEGVMVRRESRTYASITFQNFFRNYEKLAGMTGTALTSSEEFFKVYRLDTIAVPTHKTPARIDQNDLIFQSEVGKIKALVAKVKELHAKGQPVLIGTVSIEKNEVLSEYLRRAGVPHEVLNAKNHEKEGEIIAQAGRKGAVTIATNMAGRGVDIKLGGINAPKEAYELVKSLGGLYVIGTERHEARRIDNQLRGRSGRQGDPGETQFYVSLEDSLMRIFASDRIKGLFGRFKIPEDEPIQLGLVNKALESAQAKIEGFNFDSRKHVLEYDTILNQQRTSVYGRRRLILTGDTTVLDAVITDVVAETGDTSLIDTIEQKKAELGNDEFYRLLRSICLQSLDGFWMEHLETMEDIRSSVRLRGIGQRDPLVEYKREGLGAFKAMMSGVYTNIATLIPSIGGTAVVRGEETLKRELQQAKLAQENTTVSTPLKQGDKIARNDWVVIEKNGTTERMKFKKAEVLLAQGWKVVSHEKEN